MREGEVTRGGGESESGGDGGKEEKKGRKRYREEKGEGSEMVFIMRGNNRANT